MLGGFGPATIELFIKCIVESCSCLYSPLGIDETYIARRRLRSHFFLDFLAMAPR